MGLWSPIELSQMTLRLIPKILNAVDVVMPVSKQHAVVDAAVLELGHIKRIVAAPAVRVNNAVWPCFLLYDRQQGLALRIPESSSHKPSHGA